MKKITKFLSVALSLLIVASSIFVGGVTAFANNAIWDGTTDSSLSGSGTEAAPYLITNGAELAYVVSSWTGKYFKLQNDIYLNNVTDAAWYNGDALNEWAGGTFYGHIDGAGHTIYGLYMNDTTGKHCGLISKLDAESSIKNLGIDKSYIKGNSYAGAFVGGKSWANNKVGAFTNCYVGEEVTVISTGSAAGGFIGYTSQGRTDFINCYVRAMISSGNLKAGAFVGDLWGHKEVPINVIGCYTTLSAFANNGGYNVSNSYCVNDDIAADDMQGLSAGFAMAGLDYVNGFVLAEGYPALRVFGDYPDNIVNFNTSDGKVLPFAVDADITFGNLDAPARRGDVFDGYFANSGFTAAIADTDAVSTYENVYIKWESDMADDGEIIVWDGGVASKPTRGTGSEADPYLVTNGSELLYAVTYIASYNSAEYYKLTNDIYLNDVSQANWYEGTELNNWPCSTAYSHIDGNGHVVYGLYIKSETSGQYGLVGKMELDGSIKNLGIENSYIDVVGYAGAFVGSRSWQAGKDAVISNCYAGEDVTVKGTADVGGIIGLNTCKFLKIANCYSFADVYSTGSNGYGGIFGSQWGDGNAISIENCFTDLTITGTNGRPAMNNCYQVSDNMTADDMKNLVAGYNMPGLDYENEFILTEGYPVLRVFGDYSEGVVTFHTIYGDVLPMVVADDTTLDKIIAPDDLTGYFSDSNFKNAISDTAKVLDYTDIYVSTEAIGWNDTIWSGVTSRPATDADNDGYIDIKYPSELAYIVKFGGNNGKYELVNDIIINDITVDAENGTYTGTDPINWYNAEESVSFTGEFNGNGYIVKGLFYEGTADSYTFTNQVALFPRMGDLVGAGTSSVLIKNIGLENSFLKNSGSFASGILGYVGTWDNKFTVENCYVGESVYIESYASGGIIGSGSLGGNFEKNIFNCYVLATLKSVNNDGSDMSGAFSSNNWATKNLNITGCYSTTKIYGNVAPTTLTSSYVISDKMTGADAKDYMPLLDWNTTYVLTNGFPELRVFHKGLEDGKNLVDPVSFAGIQLRYAGLAGQSVNNFDAGLRFYAAVDTNSAMYKSIGEENVEYGILFDTKEKLNGAELTVDTVNAARVVADELIGEDTLVYTAEIINLSATALDSYFVVRAYMIDGDTVYYSDVAEYCPAQLADNIYASTEVQDVMDRLSNVFADSEKFEGANAEIVTFSLFSDFHYEQGMYMSSVADLEEILKRGNDNNVDFALQLGDFCNDYIGSPEITNAYLNNSYNMSVYGIYGNHELESENNTMAVVTPLLTNRADNVVWGTADGKIAEDGSIAYYYFDKGGFRIVATDTNYSYNPTTGEWEHNPENSYGPASGNIKANALGPVQLAWLEDVLTDAANNGKKCIVLSHATFNTIWDLPSADAEAVIDIFDRVNNIKSGTVIMALNGHIHTNRSMVSNNVLFLDVNTVRNNYWVGSGFTHYFEEDGHTFTYVQYDENGNVSNTIENAPLSKPTLSQGDNTWFSADPLSAIVKITSTGKIIVDGVQSSWIYDVVPEDALDYMQPEITDNTFNLWF